MSGQEIADMQWERRGVWAHLMLAVLFSLACPSESLALSATEFSGTWTGTWNSQVPGTGSGAITLSLVGSQALFPNLTGTLTTTGKEKSPLTQVPMEGAVNEGGFVVSGTAPGDLASCAVPLGAASRDTSPTRIAGIYQVGHICQTVQIFPDAGFFEIRKTGAVSLDQQAQLDMINRAKRDTRFGAANISTFGTWPEWEPSWELR
jgi:hypothetical protein